MGEQLSIVTDLHTQTKRDYLDRMINNKVECMLKAKEYEFDYWDGDRRFGYGGYKYIPGRWKPVAQSLIDRYHLNENSSILDVGSGKGFLLYEILNLIPSIKIKCLDISLHAKKEAFPEVSKNMIIQKAQDPLPFKNDEFDLVISLGCLHNLKLFELANALPEIQRVGKQGYIMLESYRNEKELFNLQCWALTCESFFEVEEWIWIYNHFGFKGDYEFIFFE